MAEATETTVTRLLDRLQNGDRAALDELVPLVYGELRTLAHWQRLRWSGDETLGTTALVNEAYLKLLGQQRLHAGSRAHFLALAARAMRHILSNYAESRRRQKRGGAMRRVSMDALDAVAANPPLSDDQAEILTALDAALRKLDEAHPRLSRVVECRIFAAMSIDDTAAALDMSPATIKRDWVLARAWLYRELEPWRVT